MPFPPGTLVSLNSHGSSFDSSNIQLVSDMYGTAAQEFRISDELLIRGLLKV